MTTKTFRYVDGEVFFLLCLLLQSFYKIIDVIDFMSFLQQIDLPVKAGMINPRLLSLVKCRLLNCCCYKEPSFVFSEL
jgi:hypothetical protein